jgi:hypothetical protein
MRTKELSKRIGLACAALLALALLPTMTAAQDLSAVQSNGNLHLKGYGSFFVPGTLADCPPQPLTPGVTNSNICSGSNAANPSLHMINQMYVQFMLPQAQNGKKHLPIAIVHGCCLSTKSWQTTPDGRMGFDEYFVRQGFDTYMIDQVGRARSGFDAIKYNLVRFGVTPCVPSVTPPVACPQNPSILIAGDQFAWNIFRWGVNTCTKSPCSDPANDTPHPGIRFPMNTVGVGAGSNLQFFNMVIPDLNSTLGPTINTPTQMAVLADELGGAILMGHSESSGYPMRAALATTPAQTKVKGIIQLEEGCINPTTLTPAQLAVLVKIPILIEYGDFTVPRPTPGGTCDNLMKAINGAGGDMSYAWLPGLVPNSLYKGSPGPITGNEHMVMLDDNNQQIAQIFIDWLTSRGL